VNVLRIVMRTMDVPLDEGPGSWIADLVVDGLSFTDAFGGAGLRPREALFPGLTLAAGEAPHRATLVRCGCGDEGCGSVSARIRRERGVVVWEEFQARLDGPSLKELRFDGDAYDSEFARADAERGWEPTGERLAE
jgi:hypothetical protein